MRITTYERTKYVEVDPDPKNDNIMKGIAICGPGRDQRRYYAVNPQHNEVGLQLKELEEALKILELFDKEGYRYVIDTMLPATIKAIGQINACS